MLNQVIPGAVSNLQEIRIKVLVNTVYSTSIPNPYKTLNTRSLASSPLQEIYKQVFFIINAIKMKYFF